ncbi:mitochondrial 37S ribosomal protein mS35 [Aspergillus candidus]|uniref:Mitochondrial ribosomal subunit protein-domain-containing protein n=1 Tax=Aspergillus candidus TaxID=41067 RepID=A0A2I2FHJ7_ASPCN|nr:mitochondrial ribosomal subunit protein-domain-containing protein [Aspergillus candidus]PLB40106.1 mitochondrial ribosomal subunit protein-domain-containing protein [Aspergillus candidus]
MASSARSLGQTALFLSRRGSAPSFILQSRQFNTTRPNFHVDPPAKKSRRAVRPEDMPMAPEYSPDLLTEEQRSMYDLMSPEDRREFDAANIRQVQDFNSPQKRRAMFANLDKEVSEINRAYPMRFDGNSTQRLNFWGKDETDDFAKVEDADEEYLDDEMTSMAHAEVELHREVREYARIAAWDMPFLSNLAKPFSLPTEDQILRFRYTTYMGEEHPAQSKVVVELASKDLTPKHLTEDQRQTFLKLVGTRYNPDTDIVRMSCEKHQTAVQNKRALGDLVNSLIKEAKEGDSFADLPLDLRHHTPKTPLRFPNEWNMTPERRQQLEARRKERQQRDQQGVGVIDGNKILAQLAEVPPPVSPALSKRAEAEREKVAVRAGKFPQKPVVRRMR